MKFHLKLLNQLDLFIVYNAFHHHTTYSIFFYSIIYILISIYTSNFFIVLTHFLRKTKKFKSHILHMSGEWKKRVSQTLLKFQRGVLRK